MNFIKSS